MTSPPNFQKSDPGMKTGLMAVDDCLSTCQSVHTTVVQMRQDLTTQWQGLAGTMFRNAMEGWESDYQQIIQMLGNIRMLIEGSDKTMTGMEEEIAAYAGPSFGDSSTPGSNNVFNTLAQ